jgi:hypothetical protein
VCVCACVPMSLEAEACDWQSYLNRYADLKKAFGNDLAAAKKHYGRHGKKEGRDCTVQARYFVHRSCITELSKLSN